LNKKTFRELEAEYNQLWMEGKTNEVLEKVKEAARLYPQETYTINQDFAAIYMHLGQLDKTKKILEESIDKGILYPKMYFRPILENEEFKEIFEKWEVLREELQQKTKFHYLVFEPEDYDKSNKYPMFIAIHGWGEDAEFFSEYWKSSKLSKEYILVLPQSSQVVGSKNFAWDDNSLAHEEISSIYKKIIKDYSVDTDNVIIGGFSQGATLALEISLNTQIISTKGFISLCPDKPQSFNLEAVKEAKAKGIKGCIITGDQDASFNQQKEMVDTFKEAGFNYEFDITEGLGHWFPKDLSAKLDTYIDFIVK